MQNLDAIINELSYEIFKKIKENKKIKNNNDRTKPENLCNKALGVLVNDGPYAFILFILKNEAKKIYLEPIFENKKIKKLFGFDSLEYEQEIIKLSQNLTDYLFFKQIVEKILIYLRYHLKTLSGED